MRSSTDIPAESKANEMPKTNLLRTLLAVSKGQEPQQRVTTQPVSQLD